MKITIPKAIEILELNLKEAGSKMPVDCQTAVWLALDVLAGLSSERRFFGFTRIGQLPHEERDNKN